MRLPIIILIVIFAVTIFAPLIAPFDPLATQPESSLAPPSLTHLLGTDLLGRDVLSRLLYGGRNTLFVTAMATLITLIPGFLVGVVVGYSGGWLDRLSMTLVNTLLAIPALVIALVLLTLLGQGRIQIAIATGIAQVATYTQVIRSMTRIIQSSEYITSARAVGAGHFGIIKRHIMPNIQITALGFAGVIFGYNVLNAAALSFLGLAGSLSTPDWGVMLAEGRASFLVAPWVSIAPGIAITLTVYCVNRLADNLSQVQGVM